MLLLLVSQLASHNSPYSIVDNRVKKILTNALSSSVKIISETFYEIVRVYEKNRRLIITNSIEIDTVSQ